MDNWDEDLPDGAEEQCHPPQLIRVNKINDIWMEIPRYVNHGWLGLWVMVLIAFSSLCFCLLFSSSFTKFLFSGMLEIIFSFFLFAPLITLIVLFIKTLLFEPRGAPVRFNRKRQKVYVYEYHRSSWNPWQRWHAEIKVFNWADIHAERVLMAGHADWGHRVYCSVCKPGTFEVVDRFVLTWVVGSIFDAYGLWSHCCHYMEAKPVPTAPLLTDVPLSWTPFNTVRWPHDLDKESTSAAD
ncbi:DUF6708 domain-containing protein [Erwinia sp. JUb26]|uniref:DUF6708 domain-containing protein n=1 Tax=Erwinia sp. JUb26 TaxID=2485126 RepID=UPI001F42BD4B|nr:DUF6708 domain-containing protein [Erwinia sp. JUb26]